MKNNSIFNEKTILVILIVIAVLFVLHWLNKKFKRLVLPNVFLVTGGVKTGKSLLSVHLVRKLRREVLIPYYIRSFFRRLFGMEVDKKPMVYSNIPLRDIEYCPLTKDIVLGQVRIPDKSIVFIDEVSLFADSMNFKDFNTNNQLLRFVKLFGHYSHNGYLICNTQSLSDCHYAFKRCLNSYLYIYSRTKLPFVTCMEVREMLYSADSSMINVSNEDIQLTMRKILIWNSTYNKYDSLCYSIFTDYKPFQVEYGHKLTKEDSLKCGYIVTFQRFAEKMNEEYKKHLEEELKRTKELEDLKNEKE